MWLWRDWVIQAFNDNKPYDRFLVEQLAGDLLPNRTDADLIALAREMLWNPNWAMDAAAKLGVDPFGLVPPQAGWWLERRAASMPSLVPSTGTLGAPPA
jgi:hypothetical protein